VVSTDVVVVEIVLSWSAMEEISCCEDEVNDDCASVGDDMRDMDAEGEWPFLRWKYSWSSFIDSVREWRPYLVGESGLMCCEEDRSWKTSLGLLGGGAGSGGGFLATRHTSTTFLGVPIASGALPGSPESHKGTKLLFDEDLLRLIASPALSKEVEMQEKGDTTRPWDGHCTCWLCLQTAQSGKTCGA
jgi:hypothetical protein